MKISFLGQGPFAKPIERALRQKYHLVSVGQSDICVVASWGKILAKHELNQPKLGTLNIHPSLLPKYRGATPIQWTILNGDQKTGVTIIKMDELMDHGPILAQKKIVVSQKDTNRSLAEKLAQLGGDMIVKLLPQYYAAKSKSVEQNHAEATFVYRLKKEDGLLNMHDTARMNERKVRALWPWPGTWVVLRPEYNRKGKEQKLFIHQAHVEHGKFIPDIVQLEGRKRMTFKSFKSGWRKSLPPDLEY